MFNRGHRQDSNAIHRDAQVRGRFGAGGWLGKGNYGYCHGNVGFVMLVEHLAES